MAYIAADDRKSPDAQEPRSVDSLLERYSLAALARIAGLKTSTPIERLLGSPRYGARLIRYFAREAARADTMGEIAPVAPSSLKTRASIEVLFEAIGLCWGMARRNGGLTPQEMATLRGAFSPEVIELANSGLPSMRVAPALAVPPGIAWLTPESCRSFGEKRVSGWLSARQPEASVGSDRERRRIEALDGMIEAFLEQQEQGT